jgi:glutathione-independent formaldehyde dehydrogenase
MKALVYHAPFEVAVEQVPDPRIEQPLDAVIRITTANICGSDLHPYEGRAALDD